MEENKINIVEILKDCPKGTKFYTTVWGEVSFKKIVDGAYYTIEIYTESGYCHLTKNGCYVNRDDAECIIFPSKEQRDWSKFTAPWYKKEKFDPKTLKPFDKVLVRDSCSYPWKCMFYSHTRNTTILKYVTVNSVYEYCIPYNDDTKHLVGTTEEAPEYYRYWEN